MAIKPYILGIMSRDDLIKTSIVENILNKTWFEQIYSQEPFFCSMMLDNFEQYLCDINFSKTERQLSLFQFLRNNYPLEVIRRVIRFVLNSDLKEDYIRILMEWQYNSSDWIRAEVLSEFDSSQFAFDIETKIMYDDSQDNLIASNEIVPLIILTSKEEEDGT